MKDLIKKILKEDNDFDWVRDTEPVSMEEIAKELTSLRDFGYYIHKADNNRLVRTIHNLGLDHNTLNTLYKTLEDFADIIHENGREEGLQEAWGDARAEGYSEGYDEGWYEGREEGYQKGREEGSEEAYYKAFEEGRAYEAGVEVEDLERIESGFDPREYDEDYDENY